MDRTHLMVLVYPPTVLGQVSGAHKDFIEKILKVIYGASWVAMPSKNPVDDKMTIKIEANGDDKLAEDLRDTFRAYVDCDVVVEFDSDSELIPLDNPMDLVAMMLLTETEHRNDQQRRSLAWEEQYRNRPAEPEPDPNFGHPADRAYDL